MNLSQTELDLYQELQPYFSQDWEVGDFAYDLMYYSTKLVVTKVYAPDKITVSAKGVDIFYGFERAIDNLIRLPLPIDPGDPERISRGKKPRGLEGMIKEFRSLILQSDKTWVCTTWDAGADEKDDEEGNYSCANQRFYYGTTPTLALLKALKEQTVQK